MLTMRSARPSPALALFVLLGLAACGDDGGAPDPVDGGFPDVTHVLDPTDEMRDAAARQCLEDDTLQEGYVKAVIPETGELLAEISVPCDDVRDGVRSGG